MTFREFEDALVDKTINDQRDVALAPYLGLTVKQLSSLEYEVTEDLSKDGLLYQFIVTFADDSPKRLLSKVKGLEGGNMVFVPPSVFNSPDWD